MENEKVPVKKPDPVAVGIGLLVWGFLAIAGLFAAGGLAVLAIKWFVSLIKGGF
jgi:hypothetical protein